MDAGGDDVSPWWIVLAVTVATFLVKVFFHEEQRQ